MDKTVQKLTDTTFEISETTTNVVQYDINQLLVNRQDAQDHLDLQKQKFVALTKAEQAQIDKAQLALDDINQKIVDAESAGIVIK